MHRPDEHYMDMALQAAVTAGLAGDVPIGAVVVHEGEVIDVADRKSVV